MATDTRLRVAGVVAGVGSLLVGTAFGAEKAAVRRIRHRDDPDRGRLALPEGCIDHAVNTADGSVLHVVESGSGPPIVLLHGVTLSVATWTKQLRSLPAAGYRTIAIASRGHGASTCGTAGYGTTALAEDLAFVLEDMDLSGAIVVGHSMGGMGLLQLALSSPDLMRERVAGMVLLSTMAGVRATARGPLRALVGRRGERLPDFGAVIGAHDLGFLLARIGLGKNPLPSHVELTRRMIRSCSAETRRDAVRALLSFDVRGALGEIDTPTLIICGTADVITPPSESRTMAKGISGARLEWIPGGGHMLMLERAGAVDALIEAFAAAHVSGGARKAGRAHPARRAGTAGE